MRKAWVVGVLLLLALNASAATRITDIDLTDKKIKETDTFRIKVDVKSPQSGMIIDFYIDENYINSVNVGSSRDEYESNNIDLREDPLGCGTHTANAILHERGSNDTISKISMDFSVGNLPDVRIEPEKPLVHKEMRVYLADPDSGSPVVGVKVEVYNTKEDRTSKASTQIDGARVFTPPNHGRYDVTVDDNKYCGTFNVNVKNILRVDGPHPENPVVGELITLAVPMTVGVKVLDENGDTYLTAFTSAGGGANFSINDSGDYRIVIGELSNRYWGINKSITVSGRPVPEISFNPENAIVGKSVSMSVTSRDAPLTDASVTISGPDKSFDSFVTPSSGTLSFTPMAVGEYTIHAEKPRYDSISKTLMVKNELYLDTEPESPAVGGNVTVIVRNQLGHVVAGVAISLDGEEMGVTDVGGRYTLALTQPKNYTIKASKKDIRYWDAETLVSPATELRVSLSNDQLRAGETTAIRVYDKLDNEMNVALSVKDPAGRTTALESKTFTPQSPGTYYIIATKEGYGTTSKKVAVKAQTVDVAWTTRGKKLVVAVSSDGNPLPGITVTFKKPIEGTLVTNEEGKGVVNIDVEGTYEIEVNAVNKNENYETRTESRVVAKDRRLGLLFFLILVITAITAAALFVVHKKIGRGGGQGIVQTKLSADAKPTKKRSLRGL